MEINVNEEKKIVSIWMTRDESGNAALRERLRPLYKEYRARKYLVAVFGSGKEDLSELTYALIRHNRVKLT